MLKKEKFVGMPILSAIAAAVTTSVDQAKWKRLIGIGKRSRTEDEPLFFLKNGEPLPVVGRKDSLFAEYGFLRNPFIALDVAQLFKPELEGNILLRLRAMLGVNARAEIILFLLLNECGTPRAVAMDSYFYPSTVSKALAEMNESGYVISRVQGRHRHYSLTPKWRSLLIENDPPPSWTVWARAFSALEQVWILLQREDLMERPLLEQSSVLRRTARGGVASQLDRSGVSFVFGNDSERPGESFIPFFVERLECFLETLESYSPKTPPDLAPCKRP